MTTREEAKAKLETLSDSAFEEVVKVIERQEYVARQMAALQAFAEDWTPEEQAAWDEGTKRRPWRTAPAEDDT
ncbi:hypothetical protein [Deinococcus sp. AJ005]|uniref:hypothetical protein n=1 Tax=Deinococcus sp. AJ005 TaxID=2652443 RepID=UPI00125CC0B1|nr:hypothetical protein [Deinococcus sp. AJ005]QFP76844.1 hypothetical protein DAAJ005_10540 [Deinococcus sp. AJ005]